MNQAIDMQAQIPMIQPILYNWLCLDIETAEASPESIESWMRYEWTPAKSWKDSTIGKRWREAYEKKEEKLALMDESPIITVGLRSNSEIRCLHIFGKAAPIDRNGALVEGYDAMLDMLLDLRKLLETLVSPETVITGHNIRYFDLPKLRHAYLSNGLRPPTALLDPTQPLYDTMREWHRYSISNNDKFVSADYVWAKLGIESHKNTVSGAEIPELYKAGEFGPIVDYQLLDVIREGEAFLRMTGQADGLK